MHHNHGGSSCGSRYFCIPSPSSLFCVSSHLISTGADIHPDSLASFFDYSHCFSKYLLNRCNSRMDDLEAQPANCIGIIKVTGGSFLELTASWFETRWQSATPALLLSCTHSSSQLSWKLHLGVGTVREARQNLKGTNKKAKPKSLKSLQPRRKSSNKTEWNH